MSTQVDQFGWLITNFTDRVPGQGPEVLSQGSGSFDDLAHGFDVHQVRAHDLRPLVQPPLGGTLAHALGCTCRLARGMRACEARASKREASNGRDHAERLDPPLQIVEVAIAVGVAVDQGDQVGQARRVSLERGDDPVGDVAVRRRIGYLPENPFFYDNLTAEELLEQAPISLDLHEIKPVIDEHVVDRLGISFDDDVGIEQVAGDAGAVEVELVLVVHVVHVAPELAVLAAAVGAEVSALAVVFEHEAAGGDAPDHLERHVDVPGRIEEKRHRGQDVADRRRPW